MRRRRDCERRLYTEVEVERDADEGKAGVGGDRAALAAAAQATQPPARCRRTSRRRAPVGAPEPERPSAAPRQRVSAFVQQPVVMPAQANQVAISVGPPSPQISMRWASTKRRAVPLGEAAAAVARCQRTSQRRRNRSRLANDSHRSSRALEQRDDLRVARRSTCCICSQRRAVFQLAALSSSASAESRRIDVHDVLIAVAAAALDRSGRQARVREHRQRVSTSVAGCLRERFRASVRQHVRYSRGRSDGAASCSPAASKAATRIAPCSAGSRPCTFRETTSS